MRSRHLLIAVASLAAFGAGCADTTTTVAPKELAPPLGLTSVTGSGAVYSFLLTEGAAEPDLKLYVASEGATGQSTEPRRFYTSTEVEQARRQAPVLYPMPRPVIIGGPVPPIIAVQVIVAGNVNHVVGNSHRHGKAEGRRRQKQGGFIYDYLRRWRRRNKRGHSATSVANIDIEVKADIGGVGNRRDKKNT